MVPEATPIAEGELSYLNLTDDAVYYVDQKDGTAVPGLVMTWYGALKRHGLSSGETTTVFAPQQSYFDDVLVTADSLYLATNQGSLPHLADVYRLPLSGQGDATLVSANWSANAGGFSRKPLLGIVGNDLVVDGASGIVALSLSDGSSRSVLADNKQLVSVQLSGNQLWYATKNGQGGIFRVDVSAPGSMPVEVYPKGCTNGVLTRTGWFLATSSELACGGTQAIQGLALDGTGETRSWDLTGKVDATTYYPTYADADAFYLASSDYGVRLPRASGSPEYFHCEATPVTGILGNASWLVWARNLQPNAAVGTSFMPILGDSAVAAIYAKRR
jgi:hypothetical protein